MQTFDFKLRPLKPKHPIKLGELEAWCQAYEKANKYPIDDFGRFMVALYQIHQGLEWHDIDNRAESYMASSLHFIMVASRLDLCIETEVFEDLIHVPYNYQEAKTLLSNISKSAQQLFYYHRMMKTQRGSRYSKKVITHTISAVIMQLMRSVPAKNRIQGIYDATTIMCGIL